ncbi:hypothetical protein ACHAW6_000056, partial [Cyclotella cf. meneghiniana]
MFDRLKVDLLKRDDFRDGEEDGRDSFRTLQRFVYHPEKDYVCIPIMEKDGESGKENSSKALLAMLLGRIKRCDRVSFHANDDEITSSRLQFMFAACFPPQFLIRWWWSRLWLWDRSWSNASFATRSAEEDVVSVELTGGGCRVPLNQDTVRYCLGKKGDDAFSFSKSLDDTSWSLGGAILITEPSSCVRDALIEVSLERQAQREALRNDEM